MLWVMCYVDLIGWYGLVLVFSVIGFVVQFGFVSLICNSVVVVGLMNNWFLKLSFGDRL